MSEEAVMPHATDRSAHRKSTPFLSDEKWSGKFRKHYG
jgi:hypothetical protein